MKKIWINAGELSGDIQSAAFLSELKKLDPSLDVVGMGGSHLQNAGMRVLYRIEELSVMGIAEVIAVLPRIIKLLGKIKASLTQEKPDLIVLTDCPDFNFFVARMAKKLNIPVVYFIPPKVWAWRTGRIQFLKANIKKIYSILPFETAFYEKHAMQVEYVGNPLVSLVDYEKISSIMPKPLHVGLMPGSRKKEIHALLPEFARTATLLQERFQNIEFSLIRAPHFTEEYLRTLWTSSVPLNIVSPENPYAFMRTCTCILAASGTAVLETALACVPTLVTYKVSSFSYFIGKNFVKVPWISLPNLIMQKEIFPECIQEKANPETMSNVLSSWLSSPEKLATIEKDCDELRKLCGDGKSAQRLANALYNDLKSLS